MIEPLPLFCDIGLVIKRFACGAGAHDVRAVSCNPAQYCKYDPGMVPIEPAGPVANRPEDGSCPCGKQIKAARSPTVIETLTG
jgi:hypothetical protein